MTDEYSLLVHSVAKNFGRRQIFRDFMASYEQPGIYGVEGQNGSGKSTLLKIFAGLLAPSKGSVEHVRNGQKVRTDEIFRHIGFVAPYLNLYDEFSAEENLKYFAGIRGLLYDQEHVSQIFHRLGLADRRKDLLRSYSSGMKQRFKFLFALMHSPPLILLDEPTSNLDAAGKKAVYELIQAYAGTSRVIIASNEPADLSLCKECKNIEDYK